MHTELEKIDLYFSEVNARWRQNAEMAISREFFVLWQEIQVPRPFSLADDEEVCIGGMALDLVSDTDRTAFCTWDAEAMCPVLIVEGNGARQEVLLLLEDGQPVIEEQAPAFTEEEDVTYGERLEVIFDVIHHVRRKRPEIDIRTLRGRAFSAALDAVAAHHPAHVMRLMKRLRRESRDRLFERALADYAVDELSNQLELPLDGSFAVATVPESPRAAPVPRQTRSTASEPGAGAFRIAARTSWEISLDLAYLEQCCRSKVALRREVALCLRDAEVLSTSDGGILTIRMSVGEKDAKRLEPGDRLRLVRDGGMTPVGELRIDLIEGEVFYGRIRWSDVTLPGALDGALLGVLSLGPDEVLASGLAAMQQLLKQGNAEATGAAGAALGAVEAGLRLGSARSPEPLDDSQRRCFAAAVEEGNPIVLVQGPPGTGKTCVLEHVVRELCGRGRQILITAPSNAAVDNICRRLHGLPVLRTGHSRQVVAPAVADRCWAGDDDVLQYVAGLRQSTGSLIVAGTQVGVLRSMLVQQAIDENGLFDAVVFDEAGMARSEEMLLVMGMGRRAVCFGDPMQLPPHPLETEVLKHIEEQAGVRLRSQRRLITHSGMEWLTASRGFPLLLLTQSYRCQNPRLMRFASTLFYDARVRAHGGAEYFTLPFHERRWRYPAGSLRLYSTSALPGSLKQERLVVEGSRPGIENALEAAIAVHLVKAYLQDYPAQEITVITPYRRQARLIRRLLIERASEEAARLGLSDDQWREMVHHRVSTVDSFQGGESDVVIISYVRSNNHSGIGFTADPNRVNVAHTRARREMVVIADSECLVDGCRADTFRRMVRAFDRDGDIVHVDRSLLKQMGGIPTTNALENMVSMAETTRAGEH